MTSNCKSRNSPRNNKENGCGNDGDEVTDVNKSGVIRYLDGGVYHGQVSTVVITGLPELYPSMDNISHTKCKHGQGELTWPDGSKYIGEFVDDLRHGEGIHQWSTGDMYEGEYYRDQRHGKGVYKWSNGAKFEGMFCHEMKDGYGKYTSAKGEVFEGMYHEDYRDGQGTLTYTDGTNDSGIWKRRLLHQLNFPAHGINFEPYTINLPELLQTTRKTHVPSLGQLERQSEEFIMSAANNSLKIIEGIIDAEVLYPHVRDSNLCSPFFAAAINGNCDIVEFLLDFTIGMDINQTEINGVTALNACHHLLYSAHPDVAKILFPSKDLKSVLVEEDNEKSLPVMPPNNDHTLKSSLSSPSLPTSSFQRDNDDDFSRYTIGELNDYLLQHEWKQKCSIVSMWQIPGHDREMCSLNLQPLDSNLTPPLSKSRTLPAFLTSPTQIHSALKSMKTKFPRRVPGDTKQDTCDDHQKGSLSKRCSSKECFLDSVPSSPAHDLDSSPVKGWPSSSEEESKASGISLPPVNIENKRSSFTIDCSDSTSSISLPSIVKTVEPPTTTNESPSGSNSSASVMECTPKNRQDGGRGGAEALGSKLGSDNHGRPASTMLPSLWKFRPKMSMDWDSLDISSLNHPSRKSSSVKNNVAAMQSTSHDATTGVSTCKSTSPPTHSSRTVSSTSLDSGDKKKKKRSNTELTSPAPTKAISLPPYHPDMKLKEMIKLLLKRGASATASVKPVPPLVYAIFAGDADMAERLLSHGADPHYIMPSKLGDYPLLHMVAKTLNHATPVMLELLLCHSVSPDLEHNIVKNAPPTPAVRYKIILPLQGIVEKEEEELDEVKLAEIDFLDQPGIPETLRLAYQLCEAQNHFHSSSSKSTGQYTVSTTSAAMEGAAANVNSKPKVNSSKKVPPSSVMKTAKPSMSRERAGLAPKSGLDKKSPSGRSAVSVWKTRLDQDSPVSMNRSGYHRESVLGQSAYAAMSSSSTTTTASGAQAASRKQLLSRRSSANQGPEPSTRSTAATVTTAKKVGSAEKVDTLAKASATGRMVAGATTRISVAGKMGTAAKAGAGDKVSSSKKVKRDQLSPDQAEEEQGEEITMIAGENEGTTKLTAIQFLCGTKLTGTTQEKKSLSDVISMSMELLIKRGADINRVFMGHSPLSMALMSGHDHAVRMLIDNGADPNLPLGSGIGNVLCVMTTHMAHKIRLAAIKQSCSGESSSSSSSRETGTMTPIQLVDYLMIFGAHLTAPVKFSKDFVGVVTDFAHATFKTDRRLALVKYSSLSENERIQYVSIKKLQKHLLNLFRCRALISVARGEDLLQQVAAVEEHVEYISEIELKLRVLHLPPHSQERKDAVKKAQTFPDLMVLPENTLRQSLEAINHFIESNSLEEEDYEEKEIVVETSKKAKKKNMLMAKIARYKELIKQAESLFRRYPQSLTGKAWEFSDFCYECGKSGSVRLSYCTGCEVIKYCSRNCKLDNWKKGHREECNKVELMKQRLLDGPQQS